MEVEYFGVRGGVEEEEEWRKIERRKDVVLYGERLEKGFGERVGDRGGSIDTRGVGRVGVVMEEGDEEGASREDVGVGGKNRSQEWGISSCKDREREEEGG